MVEAKVHNEGEMAGTYEGKLKVGETEKPPKEPVEIGPDEIRIVSYEISVTEGSH